MAYGSQPQPSQFDNSITDTEFKEVTGIRLTSFRALRDTYISLTRFVVDSRTGVFTQEERTFQLL
jgi:hypothetical protein